jgi:hypothetical protein
MKSDHLPDEWVILREWLPDDLEQLGRACGFVRRSTGRLNVEGWLRLILMHVAGGLSLEQTMLRASELGWASTSPVALHKRLCKAQPLITALCQHMLGQQRGLLGKADPWPNGLAVRLIDATGVQEPGSTGTSWRVHYSMRMPQMVCDHFEITDESQGERLGRFEFKPGELIIADRGYSHRAGVAAAMDAGAHVLVRWNPAGFPVQDERGKVCDMRRWLKQLPIRECREKKVWFIHQGRKYGMRLCAMRKSKLATQAARAKAREAAADRGTQIQPQTLDYAGYVMVLCSASRKQVSATVALGVYRGRWQVELAFKRLKSLLDAGHVPKENDDSARAWMQAKLLSALLIERTLWEGEFLSPSGHGSGKRGAPQPLEHIY